MSGFDYKSIDVEKTTLPKMYKNSEKYFEEGVQPIEVEGLEIGDFLDDNKKSDFKEEDIKGHGESIPRVNRIDEPVEPHFDADTAENIVDQGDFMGIDGDYEKIIDIFGGQLDDHGCYGSDPTGCSAYSRGYAIYLQSGKIPDYHFCGESYDGTTAVCGYGDDGNGSRKEQAEYVYEFIKENGRPCVIHVNSGENGSGQGHWLCVVGYKKGVTKENVTIEDLVVIDPASPSGINGTSASVRYVGDDKYYGDEDLGRCSDSPGYHVYYYDEN